MQKLSSNIIIAPLTVEALWLLLLDVGIVRTENYYSSYYYQALHSESEQMNVEHLYDYYYYDCDWGHANRARTSNRLLVHLMDCYLWRDEHGLEALPPLVSIWRSL